MALYDRLGITTNPSTGQTVIGRLESTGQTTPFWTLHRAKTLTFAPADPRLQNPHAPLATAKFHSWSSKVSVVLRGEAVQMKSNTMGTKIKFAYYGGEWSWSVASSLTSRTLHLKDAAGVLVAVYKRNPDGMLSGSHPVIEILVPPAALDMDMVVVTGLVAVEYWAREKKDSIEVAGEMVGASVS